MVPLIDYGFVSEESIGHWSRDQRRWRRSIGRPEVRARARQSSSLDGAAAERRWRGPRRPDPCVTRRCAAVSQRPPCWKMPRQSWSWPTPWSGCWFPVGSLGLARTPHPRRRWPRHDRDQSRIVKRASW